MSPQGPEAAQHVPLPAEPSASMEDASWLDDAVRRIGLVSDVALAECELERVAAQREGRPVPRLVQLLVRRGLLSVDQLVQVVRGESPTASCPSCGHPTTLPDGCRRCSGATPVIKGPPPAAIGRYAVTREIARGGMGVVYQAIDPALGRVVALKLLVGSGPPDSPAGKRLRREASLAGRLQHPGIVGVHEVGVDPGSEDRPPQPFIAMSFVEGDDLATVGPTLDRDARVELLAQVAEAVGEAHAQGVIHRDLKPANVLIRRQDGAAVVTDFGLGRALGDSGTRLTESGAQFGTAAYMSPEQVRGERDVIGPPSDVWSLGVMLFELLAERRPFIGPPAALYAAILEEPPPPLWSPDGLPVPDGLAAIVHRALAKSPARRFPTAAELGAALRRWQTHGESRADQARRARQLSGGRRVWTRRVALWAVVFVLLVGVGWVGRWALRSRRLAAARVDAEAAAERSDWREVLAACERGLAIEADPALTRLAERARAQRAAAERERTARQAQASSEAAWEAALAPLARRIEVVRTQFYIPTVDIVAKLAEVERELVSLQTLARKVPAAERDPRVWSLLGIGWSALGRVRSAEQALKRTLALVPDQQRAHALLGRLYLHRALRRRMTGQPDGGWTERAATHLGLSAGDASGELDRRLASAYRALAAGQESRVRVLCQQALAELGDAPGVEAFLHLQGWVSSGPERLALWTKALERRPHDAWLRYLRGVARYLAGRPAEALADLDRALQINPHQAVAFSDRGLVHLAAGRLEAARVDLERAIAIDPELAVGHFNLGTLHQRAGRPGVAVASYGRALELEPDDGLAHLQRGAALQAAGDYDLALADFKAAAGRLKADHRPWMAQGALHEQLGRWTEAEAAFVQAVALAPGYAPGWFHRGTARAELGQTEAAIADYDRALRLQPGDAQVHLRRGQARERSGDTKGALADYRTVTTLAPGRWQPLALLGRALAGAGQVVEARRVLQRALAAAPRGERATIQRLLDGLGD